MKKRLYFLFPDDTGAQLALETLNRNGIKRRHIHAIAKEGVALRNLPRATKFQREDIFHQAEYWLWRINLVVFGLFLAMFVYGLYTGSAILAVAGAIVMLATFGTGVLWAQYPDSNLREMAAAMSHGEVVLLVDVPVRRAHEIEALIEHRHPDGEVGGVSWIIDAFGL